MLKIIIRFIVLSLFVCLVPQKINSDSGGASGQKIKIYAMYTPSHEAMMNEWFLPSIKDDYEVVLDFFDPHGGQGTFRAEDWFRAVEKKVDLIIKAINDNWGSVFVFSDVDITFYGPTWPELTKAIKDKDMVFQKDSPLGSICTGFFACRANRRTLKFWKKVLELMAEHKNDWHDQTAANYLISNSKNRIRWGYLPNSFYGGGLLTGKRWNPGDELPVPKNILMHHANFTSGTENKLYQLEYVRSVVEKRSIE